LKINYNINAKQPETRFFQQYLRHFLSDVACRKATPSRFWPQQKPGFSQKPGFLGVRVERMSVLTDPRNPVGKKPGFLIPLNNLAGM